MPSKLNAISTGTPSLKFTAAGDGALEIQNDGNTAISISNTGISTFTSNLEVNGTLTSNNALILSSGSEGEPALVHSGDPGTGMYFPGNDSIAFAINGAHSMRILPNGGIAIARTTALNGATLSVSGTVSASFAGRMYSLGTYNNTTAQGSNMVIALDGHMFRSTSSLKYKTDIKNAEHGLSELMTLRPVTYKGINDGDKIFGGLIAEEVHDAGLTEFVEYAEDGSPDGLSYGHMISICIKAIQEMKIELDEANSRILELEKQITK
jgi:hypothetical protein